MLTLTFQTVGLRRARSSQAHYQTGERATSIASVTFRPDGCAKATTSEFVAQPLAYLELFPTERKTSCCLEVSPRRYGRRPIGIRKS